MSNQKEKACKYGCNKTVVWKGKSGEPGSTGFFEANTNIEHTFDRCRKLKSGIGLPPSQTTTAPPTKDNGSLDPAVNTRLLEYCNQILDKFKDMQYQIDELKKILFDIRKNEQTNATILDRVAQNNELLVSKIGYPGPEKITTREEFEPYNNPETLQQKKPNIAESITIQENNRAFQDTQEKIKKDLDEDHEKAAQILAQESAKVFKEHLLPAIEKTMPESEHNTEWNQIKMLFMCASCQTKSSEGYEKYGTKICLNCHNDIEATNMAMKYDEVRDLEREEVNNANAEYDY
jgi:hypothetical protein